MLISLLCIEAVKGFKIRREENQGDHSKTSLSLVINVEAAQELPKSGDAGISGLHDLLETRFFPKPKGWI